MPGEQARSFGAAAQAYDRHRPPYAPGALTWALGERPLRIADVGAGTGILSRQLRRLGHRVIAVEPDHRMRRRLVEASPGVAAVAGAAERMPLVDACVDAVVAGQAYHWFDAAAAHDEFARVLRPGGVFAAMWNDWDPGTPWTGRLAEAIDGPAGAAPRPDLDFGARFGPVARAEFPHEVPMTTDGLVAMASTRSPYLVADDEGKRVLIDAVRRVAADAGLADREPFAMPYVTRIFAGRSRVRGT